MCFDWRSGFSAATGSVILTVRDATDIIQQSPVLSQLVRRETLCGTSLAIALTLMRNPAPRRPLPRWVQLCVEGTILPIVELVRGVNAAYVRIFPEDIRRTVRIYGGFIATYCLVIFQGINVYRWQYQGIETAASLVHIGYVSTVFLDLIFINAIRFELEPRDYLVRTCLSVMNIFGVFISFQPEMWERIYYLFIPSSLTAISMRNFDILDPRNFVDDGRREDVPPPDVRIPNGVIPRQVIPPVVAALEDGNLGDNESSNDENN